MSGGGAIESIAAVSQPGHARSDRVVEEREPRGPQSGDDSPDSVSASPSPPSSAFSTNDDRPQQTRFCFYQPIEVTTSQILPNQRNESAENQTTGGVIISASDSEGCNTRQSPRDASTADTNPREISVGSWKMAPTNLSQRDRQTIGGAADTDGTRTLSSSSTFSQNARIPPAPQRSSTSLGTPGFAANAMRFNFYDSSSSTVYVNQEDRDRDLDRNSDADVDDPDIDAVITRIDTETANEQLEILKLEAELLAASDKDSAFRVSQNPVNLTVEQDGAVFQSSEFLVPELTPSEDSTDEILRSLQETEEQHAQLRIEARAKAAKLRSNPAAADQRSNAETTGENRKKVRARRSASLTDGTSSPDPDLPSPSHSVPTSYPTTAAHLVHANDFLPQSRHTGPQNANMGLHSPRSEGVDAGNPYEDAIKEALDLLRRHRSPSTSRLPQQRSQQNEGILSSFAPLNSVVAPVRQYEGSEVETYRETSRIPNPIEVEKDDCGDIYEEIDNQAPGVCTSASTEDRKIKVEERQVRMADYASRLQEFKSSISMEAEVEPWRRNAEYIPGSLNQVRTYDESLGVSDVSLSSKTHDEEVQRGVERVLLAILERASTSRSRASRERTDSVISQASSDEADTNKRSADVLVRAMDTLLSQPATIEYVDSLPEMLKLPNSSQDGSEKMVTDRSIQSKSTIHHSVVDELLAEDDESSQFANQCETPASSNAVAHMGPYSWSSSINEEKKLPEMVNESHVEIRANSDDNGIEAQETSPSVDLSDLIDTCLQNSSNSSNCESEKKFADAEDEGSSVDEGTDSSQSDQEDQCLEESYNEDSHDETDDGLDRVLGPLSQKAGGTTGVVLDLTSDSEEQELAGNPTVSVMDSFSTVIKDAESIMSYVANAISSSQSKDAGQLVHNNRSPISVSREANRDEDPEATELMRTLCAHLFPFGVVQSNNLIDAIPPWDEENVNEPGYRIIRLTKVQLRRVERAFEVMVNGLKRESQRHLKELDSSNRGCYGYDANFVRELQEAEKLLDDEERRINSVKQGRYAAHKGTGSVPNSSQAVLKGNHTQAHPQFPSLKSAGMGDMGDLEYFYLPIIYKSRVTGFEPTKDLILEHGTVVAGQYLVESELGSAAFSTAYRCVDLSSDEDSEDGHEEVCLKVIKNTKDFFDQSLDEIKILEVLRQTGLCHENNIVEMKTFFYHREHLVIVTELLRQNLFEFGKFIVDNEEEPYFTIPRLAYITRQVLVALKFVHSLGIVHSDLKPENLLLSSYSRARVKLIDFGSSCYLTDRQSSYIQSRSYRAPEVVLGLPYDGRIDIWSLGCVVAEMFTNEVTFQNDSIVSMLSRIEAICGPFPRHMIAEGRQSNSFFTKSGLLYEVVGGSDDEGKDTSQMRFDDDSESDTDADAQFDVFQPKSTCLSSRLGFSESLMDAYHPPQNCSYDSVSELQEQGMFTDFVGKLLTIDSDSRPTAAEALEHPWMKYAESLTEDDIRYPSS